MLEYLFTTIPYKKDPSILSYFRIRKGKVEAYGDNDLFQLGLPFSVPAYEEVPIPVPISKIVQGRGHTFAIGEEGELYVCGFNFFGQLGAGRETTYLETFTEVTVPEKVSRVVTYVDTSFVIGREGRLYSCGEYFSGLERGGHFFTLVPLPSLVVDVVIERYFVFATLENGEVWTWKERGLPFLEIV